MRILVIGCTLFIRREIVRRLAQRGHEVIILQRAITTIWVPRSTTCRQTAAILRNV